MPVLSELRSLKDRSLLSFRASLVGCACLALGLGLMTALWWFSQDREQTRALVLVARDDIGGLGPQARVRMNQPESPSRSAPLRRR